MLRRNPFSDAAGVHMIMHSTARWKSSWAQTICAVSSVGTPSTKRNVPRSVSRVSGVVTESGMGVLYFILGGAALVMVVKLNTISAVKAHWIERVDFISFCWGFWGSVSAGHRD
jgi:hypothetical protein